jgi:hypothetical protein
VRMFIFFLFFISLHLNAVETEGSRSFIERMKEICSNAEAFQCSSEMHNIGKVDEEAIVYIKEPEFIFDKYCVEFENRHELSAGIYSLNTYTYVGRHTNGICSDYINYTQQHDGKSLYIDSSALDFIFSIKDAFNKKNIRSHCLNKSDAFYISIDIFGLNTYQSTVDGGLKYEVSINRRDDDVLYLIYFDSTKKVEECEGERGRKP